MPTPSRTAVAAAAYRAFPALVAVAATLAYAHLNLHLGVMHRLHSHHRVALPAVEGIVFAATLGSAVTLLGTARAALNAARPDLDLLPVLSVDDLLAAASFGAYARNAGLRRLEAPGGTATLAYRPVGPVVVALGGAAGEPLELADLRRRLLAHARRRPLVWYGAGSGGRARGIAIGEEAIVDLRRYQLGGRRMANLRHSVARARRDGVGVLSGSWRELPAPVRAEIARLESAWRRRHWVQLRFSVSSLHEAAADDRPWFVAVAPDGRVQAYTSWLPSIDASGRVLDILRRRPDSVPGSVELALHAGLEAATNAGARWASLGMSANPASLWGRIGRLIGVNPLHLRRFKDKFAPEWRPRYLVAPRVPAPVALAAAAWAHLVPARA